MNQITATQPSMTSREIAELTGKRHDNVLRDSDARLDALPSELRNGFKPSTDASGKPTRAYRQYDLDRDATVCRMAGYDAVARMKIIKRGQALESGEATPAFKAQPKRIRSQRRDKRILARAAASLLRMSATSKARMLAEIAASEGIPSTFLPSDSTGEALAKSMTDLLKDHGSAMSRHAALAAMIALGLIEKTTRTSRSSATGTAAFNSLTETGLVDGRNETSRQNPNATQVRLYADKFRELLARIEAQVEAQPQTGKRSLVAHADQPSAGGAA
jgi:hypothetical protein